MRTRPGVTLTTRAASSLDDIRESFAWARRGRTAVVDDDKGLTWWTFAGLHANAGLMAAMGPLLGGAKVDNLAIKLAPDTATTDKVRRFAEAVDPDQLPRPWIADDLAKKLKFADCLPSDVAVDVASVRVRDLAGVRRVVGEPVDGSAG